MLFTSLAAFDAPGWQLSVGAFLGVEWVRKRAPVLMGNRVAVSLDLLPALPPARRFSSKRDAPGLRMSMANEKSAVLAK